MSELTKCNYCILQGMIKDLKDDEIILKLKGTYFSSGGSKDIFIVPKGKHIPKRITKEFRKKYFACWFMELTKKCVC